MSSGWVHAEFASTSVTRLSGWQPSAALPPEATPVNSPHIEHEAYVRGLRHGFVAALWLSMTVAAIAVLIYAAAGQM
jgi:hypothetical protein